MHSSLPLAPLYRPPREMEPCWECSISHRLIVFERGPLADREDGSPPPGVVPRCPCHQRIMRRSTAPWQGCPGWLARAVFATIIVYVIWALLAGLCLVPGRVPWLSAC